MKKYAISTDLNFIKIMGVNIYRNMVSGVHS